MEDFKNPRALAGAYVKSRGLVLRASAKGVKPKVPLRFLKSEIGKIRQSPQKSLASPGEKIPNQYKANAITPLAKKSPKVYGNVVVPRYHAMNWLSVPT